MEENKKAQEKILSEEQLEEAAGGTHSSNCFFEPENPPNRRVENNTVRVKCKSVCTTIGVFKLITCRCHGSTNCVDNWHIVEQASPGLADGNWIASPRSDFNHNEGRKLIKNLFI